MSMTTVPGGAALNNLQQYQAQLQANQAALGQQLLIPPQRPVQQHQHQLQQQQQHSQVSPSLQQQATSLSIATQQQQQLMNKAMEKQNELQIDKQRVTLLLEINAELLREVLNVQPKLKSPEEAKNDPIFRECMRRLQNNLAYLAAIADRSHKPAALIPSCPGVLLAPPDMPGLDGLYKRLQDLYPGVNPANPPQQHQNAQIGPPRSGQNSSPKPQGQIGAPPNSMPPPGHGTPPRENHHLSSSPPPPQMPLHHHSPPPPPVMVGMPLSLPQHQQPQPSPTPQQQQMMYQGHPHSQSPPLQDPRIQQQVQQHHQQQQHQAQQQQAQQHAQQHRHHQQQQQQHYAQLQQQQQHRQLMMQRAQQQQQQQQQQHLQQQGHMGAQMGIPTSMGMSVGGSGMNGMQTSMAPQQMMNPGMMGGQAPGMVMAGGGMGYPGMTTHLPNPGAMVQIAPMSNMPPLGHIGMGNMSMGMAGMPPGAGFADMNQGMWNPGWQGGGGP